MDRGLQHAWASMTNACMPPYTVNWIGHWKDEDRREDWVRCVAQEFSLSHPDVHVNLKFAQEIVGEKNKRKSAEHIADMILKERYDWDVVWLDDYIYNFVAGILADPAWGKKHLVDFEEVPGFKETQKSFILEDPAYRNQTGGMIVGPYVEGCLYMLWFNQDLAKKFDLTIPSDGISFDHFIACVKRVYDYNKANHTNYAAIFESNDWIMSQNIFQSLLKSEFPRVGEANAEATSPAKVAALKKTLAAFEELGKYKPLTRAHDTKVWFETRGEVLEDQALFYPNGSWMFSHWAGIDKAKMGKMAPALLPTFRQVNHYLGGFVPTWAVLRNAPNSKIAVDLLMTMCQSRFAQMWVDYTKNPTGILGDCIRSDDSGDSYEVFQSMVTRRFGARVQFSSNPAYFLGKENALLEGVVNSALLKLLDGRISAEDAFSLIQSKTRPTGNRHSLASKVGAGMIVVQCVTLFMLGSSYLASTEGLDALQRTEWITFALGIVMSAVLASSLGNLFIHRLIIRRIRATLACVERVEKGQRAHRIDASSSPQDEIGDLQRGVNSMIDSLEVSLSDVQHAILDNVKEGFFRVDRECRMLGERSAILEDWFGNSDDTCTLSDFIRRVDPERASYFEVAWNELLEGVLPVELLIKQLPSRIHAGAKTLAFRYRPVLEGRRIMEVIVVVSDVTAEVERERAETEARNLLGMVRMLLKDREAFIQFAQEGTELVQKITSDQVPLRDLLRMIHTLKGNSGLFELNAIATLCHDIESRMLNGSEMTTPDRQSLIEMWRPVAVLAGPDKTSAEPSLLDVSRDEQTKVIRALLEGAPREEIAHTLRTWNFEPVRRQLGRFAERAQRTADRLGKGPIAVVIEDNDVRLPRDEWSAFWAAWVHLLRNAVDHGIEPSHERVKAGKDPMGRISLRAAVEGNYVSLEIADDGHGINWEIIRDRAARMGLPHETHDDLVQALFTDGLSSRETATEFSGRGVGLGAVRAACTALGGTIEVQSEPKHGSRVLMRIPLRKRVATGSQLKAVLPAGAVAR